MSKIKLIKEILKLPKVKIEIIDQDKSDEVYNTYKYFVKPHPKYKIIKNKTVGIMLFELPKTKEEYEKMITGKNSVKYFSNRCSKFGYYTKFFDKNEHLDEMYVINTSTDSRQGRAMSSGYTHKLDKEEKKDCISYFGVFTKDDKLVGYVKLMSTKKLHIVCQILGHVDYQNDNIMYLILRDLINILIDDNHDKNYSVYLMYDTYFGGGSGIKLFKKRHQFKPYKVKWVYINEK